MNIRDPTPIPEMTDRALDMLFRSLMKKLERMGDRIATLQRQDAQLRKRIHAVIAEQETRKAKESLQCQKPPKTVSTEPKE